MHRTSQALSQRNIEAQRLNNKLTYFLSVADIFDAISGYNILFTSAIIRKPGTILYQHIGTILAEYHIANIGKRQLDNIGPISVICLRKLANVTTTFDIGKM